LYKHNKFLGLDFFNFCGLLCEVEEGRFGKDITQDQGAIDRKPSFL
jgi:hypothetical protein